jgi:hypothetical protein
MGKRDKKKKTLWSQKCQPQSDHEDRGEAGQTSSDRKWKRS